MSYVYRPKSKIRVPKIRLKKPTRGRKSTNKSSSKSQDQQYIKQIIKYNTISLIIVIVSVFGFWLVFSNINNLWGIFRPTEKYVEEDKDRPAKPFVQTEQEYTNTDTVSLEGVAGEGQRVFLYKDNNQESEAIADAENRFSFDNIGINNSQDATTKFYVIAKDDNGNESEPSNEIEVTFDKEKPDLSISEPKQDDRIKSFSRSLEVKGSTEENTTVTVNGKIAQINQNNDYSAVIRLEDEVNVIKVEATDRAGNKTINEVAVYYEKID